MRSAVLVPRFATYGAALIALTMCGAIFTVFASPGEIPSAVPIVILVLFSYVAYARRGVRWMPN